MKSKALLIVASILLLSCSGGKLTPEKTEQPEGITVPLRKDKTPVANSGRSFAAGPQAIVYKTVKDYTNNVPVIMDGSKTTIVSYPAPSDIYYNGKLAKPSPLKNGYLLDNRGINENTVFLKYTYEEYSQLKEAPSMQEMLSKITDKYPLAELIDCGLRSQYKDEINELNRLIDKGFKCE
ncbi:hypothetical protein [Viscerimonas tarda]